MAARQIGVVGSVAVWNTSMYSLHLSKVCDSTRLVNLTASQLTTKAKSLGGSCDQAEDLPIGHGWKRMDAYLHISCLTAELTRAITSTVLSISSLTFDANTIANSSNSLAMSLHRSKSWPGPRAILNPEDQTSDYDDPKFIPLQPEVDLDRIRGWYAECKSHHGDSCNKRYTSELEKHVDHLVLIDANAGCLKFLPVSTSFVALSYVWGQAETTKLQRSNFEQLKRPGALDYESQELVLPNAIRDAMYLCKVLGVDYLWVDCLCVMQDASDAEMRKMLRGMAYIYANAEYTIVAASGSDANHGLEGIRGRARSLDQISYWKKWTYPTPSTWANRGWT